MYGMNPPSLDGALEHPARPAYLTTLMSEQPEPLVDRFFARIAAEREADAEIRLQAIAAAR